MPDPRIALALGSGSSRGWAHIGVIGALAEAGIEPSIVCGTSIGALVGAAQVGGWIAPLESWARSLNWREIVGFLDVGLIGGGLVKGEALMSFLRASHGDRQIEALPLQYAAVATDLDSGREIWLREGSLLDAVHASIALPGLFAPVWRDGRWLVDGGLVNPVPISLCRALGAEIVIAVNLNGDLIAGRGTRRGAKAAAKRQRRRERDLAGVSLAKLWPRTPRDAARGSVGSLVTQLFDRSEPRPGLFDVVVGSINVMQDRITRSRMAGEPPDILLAPRLAHIGLLEFDRADEAIEEGRACVARAGAAFADITRLG